MSIKKPLGISLALVIGMGFLVYAASPWPKPAPVSSHNSSDGERSPVKPRATTEIPSISTAHNSDNGTSESGILAASGQRQTSGLMATLLSFVVPWYSPSPAPVARIKTFAAVNETSPQLVGHTEPEVKHFGDTYYLYYRTDNDDIAVATSSDGQTWSERGTALSKGVAGAANLIANASAEFGTASPDNWFYSALGATWATNEASQGAKSLHLVATGASADWRSSSVGVVAGTVYKLRMDIKGQVVADQYFATVRWFASPGGNNFISETNLPVPTGNYPTWQQLSLAATAPAGAVSADIVLRAINGTGDLYFDQLSLAEAAWDDAYVISPSVETDGSHYYLFYEGNDGAHSQVGYAVASTPLGPFTKVALPVLSPQGGGFEGVSVGTPAVTRINSTWYLFYHGYDGMHDQVALAWSNDLTAWTRHPLNPILPYSSGWQSTKTAPSSVYTDTANGYVYVAYEGADQANRWSVNIARVSIDGLRTELLDPQQTAPLLSAAPYGWDNDYVQLPSIVDDGNGGLYMYYSGHAMPADSFSLGRTPLAVVTQ